MGLPRKTKSSRAPNYQASAVSSTHAHRVITHSCFFISLSFPHPELAHLALSQGAGDFTLGSEQAYDGFGKLLEGPVPAVAQVVLVYSGQSQVMVFKLPP